MEVYPIRFLFLPSYFISTLSSRLGVVKYISETAFTQRYAVNNTHYIRRLQENYGLKYLNLAMNGLADDGAKLIGQALKANQCLVDLNISSNRITTEGAIEIARGIEVNETLQTLRVR